jgi:hypothetical protein
LICCSSRFAEGRCVSARCCFNVGTPVSVSMTRPSLSGYPAAAAAAAVRSLPSSCRRKKKFDLVDGALDGTAAVGQSQPGGDCGMVAAQAGGEGGQVG